MPASCGKLVLQALTSPQDKHGRPPEPQRSGPKAVRRFSWRRRRWRVRSRNQSHLWTDLRLRVRLSSLLMLMLTEQRVECWCFWLKQKTVRRTFSETIVTFSLLLTFDGRAGGGVSGPGFDGDLLLSLHQQPRLSARDQQLTLTAH